MSNSAGPATIAFLVGVTIFVLVVAFGTWKAASAGNPHQHHRRRMHFRHG